MQKKTKPLIVSYAHDAGGAAILAAYMHAHADKYRFLPFACGPAARIYKRSGITPANSNPEIEATRHALKTALEELRPAFFLCATGGPPRLEIEMILACHALHIRSCAFLDHWVNYRERFEYPSRNWKQNLPDEIWVGDEEALRRAKQYFSRNTKIRHIPNPYFKEIRQRYKALPKKKPTNILFISEPVTRLKGRPAPYTESDVLKIVLKHLQEHWPKVRVAIRHHPAEPTDKYDALLEKFHGHPYTIVPSTEDLLKNLRSASFVIGLESVALVVAGMCGKKVLRFPPHRPTKTDAPMPGEFAITPKTFTKKLDSYVEQTLKRA